MILVDAGPLVALLDRGEQDHERCVSALQQMMAPMITTWPAYTEAMYLLGAAGGWVAQEALWRLTERGDLQILELDSAMKQTAKGLMEKYQNVPMDLAEAAGLGSRRWPRRSPHRPPIYGKPGYPGPPVPGDDARGQWADSCSIFPSRKARYSLVPDKWPHRAMSATEHTSTSTGMRKGRNALRSRTISWALLTGSRSITRKSTSESSRASPRA